MVHHCLLQPRMVTMIYMCGVCGFIGRVGVELEEKFIFGSGLEFSSITTSTLCVTR